MDENKVYLTGEGLENLKKEHKLLLEVSRPQAVERLQTARVLGDLAENSDYTQAKQDLAFLDGRVAELEQVLGRVELINENHTSCQAVALGCKVTVEADGEESIFHLVGEWEADPASLKISHQSPLGQALFGKKVGEKVEVEAPAGKIIYTILQIE